MPLGGLGNSAMKLPETDLGDLSSDESGTLSPDESKTFLKSRIVTKRRQIQGMIFCILRRIRRDMVAVSMVEKGPKPRSAISW